MDRFGENWQNHMEKTRKNWLSKISKDDIVFVPGDISWANNLKNGMVDLEFLASLPGKKYLVKGNHDRLFSDERKAKRILESMDNEISTMRLIHNNSHSVNGIGIAGTRGWSRRKGHEENEKILDRELRRMRTSLESLPDVEKLVVLLHFPPTNEVWNAIISKIPNCNPGNPNYKEEFDERMMDLIAEFKPDVVVCGHVHTYLINNPFIVKNIPIYCVSADAINFDPIEIKI